MINTNKLFLNLLILFTFIGFCTACAFSPKVSQKQEYAAKCKMFTRHLELSIDEPAELECDLNKMDLCLVKYGVVLPVGTFVVAGSIVLIGNTLHWLEYQGRCDDGMIAKFN